MWVVAVSSIRTIGMVRAGRPHRRNTVSPCRSLVVVPPPNSMCFLTVNRRQTIASNLAMTIGYSLPLIWFRTQVHGKVPQMVSKRLNRESRPLMWKTAASAPPSATDREVQLRFCYSRPHLHRLVNISHHSRDSSRPYIPAIRRTITELPQRHFYLRTSIGWEWNNHQMS